MKLFLLFLTFLTAATATAQTLPGLTIRGHTFAYDAPDGPVSGILRLPEGEGPFPAVLISHGKGGTASSFSLQHANTLVSWGIACIGPSYTHEGRSSNPPDNEGYCPENSRRAVRAMEVLAATPGVDMKRVALFGHSMGAFLSAGLAGEFPGKFKAVCLSAGGTSGTDRTGLASPAINEVGGITAPVLMFHGTADRTVLPAQSANLAEILTQNRIPHRRILYPDLGHDIISPGQKRGDIHAIMRAWFTEHGVLTAPAPAAPAVESAVRPSAGPASPPGHQ